MKSFHLLAMFAALLLCFISLSSSASMSVPLLLGIGWSHGERQVPAKKIPVKGETKRPAKTGKGKAKGKGKGKAKAKAKAKATAKAVGKPKGGRNTSHARVCYYHPNWGSYKQEGLVKPFSAKDLPIEYINEVAHSFVSLKKNGNGYVIEQLDPGADAKEFRAYEDLRRRKPTLKISLAIGGWNHSHTFSLMVSSPESRKIFINSLKAFVAKHPFISGAYLDWEYPSEKGENYGRKQPYVQYDGTVQPPNSSKKGDGGRLLELVRELRAAMPPPFHLGMCTAVAPEKLDWDVAQVSKHLDVLQVMTYDMLDGAWEKSITGHHCNLHPWPGGTYSTSKTVDFLIGKGVPPNKIAIGVAFYSRGASSTAGLGKPNGGPSPLASWTCKPNPKVPGHTGCEKGSLDYAHCPPQGSQEIWDDRAKAHYAYNANAKVFTSYDTPRSVKAKCDYVKQKGLYGILAWDTSQDKHITHPDSLTKVLYENLEA